MLTGGSDPGRPDAAGRPAADLVVLDPVEIRDGTDPLGVGAGDAPPGTYALVFDVDSPATIDVGALGSVRAPAGGYAYVGSAFGSNGLGRVARHRRVAAGAHDVTHWHVDHLGGHPVTELATVVTAPHADVECGLAAALRERMRGSADGTPVPIDGFGASDCGCPTHLVAGDDPASVRAAAVASVRDLVSPESDG